MAGSIFIDKSDVPNEQKLAKTIGKTIKVYQAIIEYLTSEFDDIKPEWKYYGKNTGWILKVFHKKRNLLFLFPCKGYFKISFVFGAKALNEIAKSDISDFIKTELNQAKQYAEGKGIQLTVKNDKLLSNILKLLKIKIAN